MGKNKQWKRNGDEDQFLLKLVKQGKIHKDTKPTTLTSNYPAVFGGFSSNVVRNHLNVVKRTNGLYLEDQSEDEEDYEKSVQEQKPEKEQQRNISNVSHVDRNDMCSSSSHQNYPILCDIYKDPDTQFEIVVMVVSLPGGVQNVKIDLSEDGITATVKYNWPEAMFEMTNLFKKQLSAKEITAYHPMIACLKSSLEKVRTHIDAAPEALLTVNLPIKVQTAPASWTKSGVKRNDGTQVIICNFTGYIKNYTKKLSDATVTFDM